MKKTLYLFFFLFSFFLAQNVFASINVATPNISTANIITLPSAPTSKITFQYSFNSFSPTTSTCGFYSLWECTNSSCSALNLLETKEIVASNFFINYVASDFDWSGNDAGYYLAQIDSSVLDVDGSCDILSMVNQGSKNFRIILGMPDDPEKNWLVALLSYPFKYLFAPDPNILLEAFQTFSYSLTTVCPFSYGYEIYGILGSVFGVSVSSTPLVLSVDVPIGDSTTTIPLFDSSNSIIQNISGQFRPWISAFIWLFFCYGLWNLLTSIKL